MKSLHTFYLVVLVISMFSQGCRKESRPGIPETKPSFTLILNDYLPSGKIDSAFLCWAAAGRTDSCKLTVNGNALYASASFLPQGEKQYTVRLLSANTVGLRKLLWVKPFVASLHTSSNYVLKGPSGLYDTAWLPRVILTDNLGLTAFCGIRPTDAHFSFYRLDTSWTRFTVDRSYWNNRGGVQKLAGAVWHGWQVLNTWGHYANDTYFSNLGAQLGNRIWNHLEIIMLFTNTDPNIGTGGLEFYQDF